MRVSPTQAFLTAVLRLRPPAPSNLQREVPAAGMMIDGTFVAGGVCILLD